MNRATYRPRKPTAAQKATAMNFYKPTDQVGIDALEAHFDAQSKPDYQAAQVADAAPAVPVTPEGEDTSHMRGRLQGAQAVARYVLAGHATVTVVSKASGKRFTYRFTLADPRPGMLPQTAPIFVNLLTGSDNTSSYQFLGCLWATDAKWGHAGGMRYVHGKKSPIGAAAPSVQGMLWLVTALQRKSDAALEKCEVWHEGRCGRCGRKLTVPASIENGIGPECAKKV